MKRLKYEAIKSFEHDERHCFEGMTISATLEKAEELVKIGCIIPVNDDMETFMRITGTYVAKAKHLEELCIKVQDKKGLSEKEARREVFVELFCTHKDCVIL